MNIIFLDFDGVLNSVQYDRIRGDGQGNIDETRLALLKELADETEARIVLTTSWRMYWEKDESLCDEVGREIHAVFEGHGLSIYDKTPEMREGRASEVEAWLLAHEEVTGFVILDDMMLGWGELASHLVRTDPRIGRGLESRHIERAKRILLGMEA